MEVRGAVADRLATLTLYPKRLPFVWLLLGSCAFVALGTWLATMGRWQGFVCAGFFALCVPIFVIQLIPGSGFLRVDATGVTYSSLFRQHLIPWSDVDAFFVVAMRRGFTIHKMVGFNYVSTYARAPRARALSKAVAKCEGGLPDTYGKTAAELVDLLNARLAATREPPAESGEREKDDRG